MSAVLLQPVADRHETYPAPRRLRDGGAWSHVTQLPLRLEEGVHPIATAFVEAAKMKECR